MNLRIVFKFKDCKLKFYEKRRLFCYFSVNPCMPASRWRRLLKLKRKKNSFKIIIGFFFTPPLFLATKVAISFVYYSPKTIKCTQKPKIKKKFTGIDQSSECHSPHHMYNSLLRMRAIHALKRPMPARQQLPHHQGNLQSQRDHRQRRNRKEQHRTNRRNIQTTIYTT